MVPLVLFAIVLFLATMALGYRIILISSKEKGVLAVAGIAVGAIIIICSLIGGVWTADYLHSILPRMNMMMGTSASRPGSPAMMPQRGPMPYPGAPMPPRVAPPAKPSTEEKK